MNKKKIFKIIELLIILLIIGIFSSMALSQYSRTIEKSHAEEALENIRKFRRVVRIWESAVQNNGGTVTGAVSGTGQVNVEVSDAWLQATRMMLAVLSDPSQKPCSKDFCYKVTSRYVKAYRANSSTYKYEIWYRFSKNRYHCYAYTPADLKLCNLLSTKVTRISKKTKQAV